MLEGPNGWGCLNKKEITYHTIRQFSRRQRQHYSHRKIKKREAVYQKENWRERQVVANQEKQILGAIEERTRTAYGFVLDPKLSMF